MCVDGDKITYYYYTNSHFTVFRPPDHHCTGGLVVKKIENGCTYDRHTAAALSVHTGPNTSAIVADRHIAPVIITINKMEKNIIISTNWRHISSTSCNDEVRRVDIHGRRTCRRDATI